MSFQNSDFVIGNKRRRSFDESEPRTMRHHTWVAVAIGGSAVIGAGASMYSANKAAGAANAGQRNLPGEIGGILGQVPAAGAAGYANQSQYGPAYAALGNANLSSGLLGNVNWNASLRNSGAQQFLQDSQDYYQGSGMTDEQRLQDYYANGYGNPQDLQRSGGLVDTLGSLQGAQDRQNAGSSTFQRQSNLTDMQNLAPGAAALRRQLNPDYYNSLGALNTAAGAGIGASDYEKQYGAMALGGFDPGRIDENVGGPSDLTNRMAASAGDGTTGPAALESTLYGQAQDALAQGGDLSAQEQRNATASSRAAYASRGLGDSNSALAGEVLNLDSARRARLDSNRNFAAGVTGLLRSGQAADRGYGLNLDAATLARNSLRGQFQGQNISNSMLQRQNDLNALGNANAMERGRGTEQFGRLGTATQLSGQNLYDPAGVLGTVDNRLNSAQTLGQGQQTFTGAPDYINQLMGYGNDVYGTNANARAAGALNSANAYGALGGGLLSAAGSLGSAYLRNNGSGGGGAGVLGGGGFGGGGG